MRHRRKSKERAPGLREFAMEFALLCFLGVVVALAIVPLLHIEVVKGLDRTISDLVMQQLAIQRLAAPEAAAPRFVFIDIDEQTCEEWAVAEGMACTKGWATPRGQLASIVEALGKASADTAQRPRLLVIDVELAPAAHQAETDATDERLCAAVVGIAQNLPVVALRPMVIRPDPNEALVDAYPSLLDAARAKDERCLGSGGSGNLWLASPLVQPDADGVVRSVHAWDSIDDPPTLAGRVAGVGFLGAALLEPKPALDQLACDFPASRPGVGSCAGAALTVAGRAYAASATKSEQDRIVFLVPYAASDTAGASPFGYAPSVIETIAAKDFVSQSQSRSSLLAGAVIIIGGSFLASDDLYTTPLGAETPGAIVHASAIRAFATAALVEEHKSWWLKAVLIVVAALIGASFGQLGSQVKRRLPPLAGDLGEILVALLGIVVTVLAVFSIAVTWAFDDLSRSGTAIGTLTPAVAVAFESLSAVMGQLRQLTRQAVEAMSERR